MQGAFDWAGGQGNNDPFSKLANIATNFATFGLAGYSNGGISEGVVTHAADEGIGQVTGRNMQRAALNQAGDAQIAAQKAADTLVANTNFQDRQRDVQASSAAAGARATAAASSSAFNPANTAAMAVGPGAKLGGDTQNFLGM